MNGANESESDIKVQPGTVDMDSLLAALEEIRAGLTDEEFAEIEQAMNAEYVEPLEPNS